MKKKQKIYYKSYQGWKNEKKNILVILVFIGILFSGCDNENDYRWKCYSKIKR